MTAPLRPQLWTFLGLAILCRVLTMESVRARRWLPLVFLVWANSHGGWVVGCGVLTAWAMGECWEDPSSRRQWVWLLPLCLSATLVTPYGWTLWHFVATTVRPARAIEEWMPLWASSPINWPWWVAAVLVSLFAVRRGPRPLPRALVLLMLAYGGLRVLRIGPLFLEVALIFASVSLARTANVAPFPRPRSTGDVAAGLMLVAAPGVAAVWLGSFALSCIPPLPHATFNLAIVRALQHAAASGRMVTYFNWGQFALWHLGPRLQVSMDGRRETIYSDARLEEHEAVVRGDPAGLATLATWRPEYVWLPTLDGATRNWLGANGYRIDLSSADEYLAVREDLPPLQIDPGLGTTRCFPY